MNNPPLAIFDAIGILINHITGTPNMFLGSKYKHTIFSYYECLSFSIKSDKHFFSLTKHAMRDNVKL